MREIIEAIEAARRAGKLNNDAARAATVALGLEGDDALLAVRLIAQGSDPASLEYVLRGSVSAPIKLAHRIGPGCLVDKTDREEWLFLAALSCDESKRSTLRDRTAQFVGACATYRNMTPRERAAAIVGKLDEIKALPFTREHVGGREMRVYDADLGFAAAYWDGEPCAAVRATDVDGSKYLAVGCDASQTLERLGVRVDKVLGPAFGLIFAKVTA